VLADDLAQGAERGCHFLNATAEIADPTHPARAVVARHKQSLRGWFERTARRAGLREPRLLGAQLLMLFDGASSAAAALGAVRARDVVRAAETLVDAARPPVRSVNAAPDAAPDAATDAAVDGPGRR
jgi:hypothetical protein